MDSIGERIRKRREERKMDQVSVAQQIGIEPPSLSQIETGSTKMPRPTTLMRLAEVLETNMHWMLTGNGDQDARDVIVDDPQAHRQFDLLNDEHKAAVKAIIGTFRAMEHG